MNFLRQGFRKLSSDKQTESTEIINHAASRVVKNIHAGMDNKRSTAMQTSQTVTRTTLKLRRDICGLTIKLRPSECRKLIVMESDYIDGNRHPVIKRDGLYLESACRARTEREKQQATSSSSSSLLIKTATDDDRWTNEWTRSCITTPDTMTDSVCYSLSLSAAVVLHVGRVPGSDHEIYLGEECVFSRPFCQFPSFPFPSLPSNHHRSPLINSIWAMMFVWR